MQQLLALSIALLVGLLLSRLTKIWNLPAVTAYLVAGILIGPFCLGRAGIPGLGFLSAADVASYSLIPDVALGFIAFSMGNEFRLADLKKIGKQAVVIAVFQALVATVLVDIALITLHFLLPAGRFPLSAAITLGAIATATAPAATLMVIKQYKSSGPVTRMLLPVVALDDVVGLAVFAVSFGIAKAIEEGAVDVFSVIVDPLAEIVASLLLGAALGFVFDFLEQFFHSRSKRMSISVCFIFLAVALSKLEFHVGAMRVGFSSLLVCMMLGTVFCNLCDFSEELMDRMDRWTGPLMVLFFVISGAGLELSVFGDWTIVLAGVIFILVRSVGKIEGSKLSAKFTHCEPTVQKFLGITLLPQAGVSLGMSLVAVQTMTALGHPETGSVIRNISLFAVLIYELVGPLLTKMALDAAGEIQQKPLAPRKEALLAERAARKGAARREMPAPSETPSDDPAVSSAAAAPQNGDGPKP